MRKAMRSTPISLAIIALVLSVPAVAQQAVPTPPPAPMEQSYPSTDPILQGNGTSAQPYSTLDLVPQGDEPLPQVDPSLESIAPGSPTAAVGEQTPMLEPLPDAGQAVPAPGSVNVWAPQGAPTPPVPAPGGGLYSVGPCDEITGQGYWCPKDWYLDQRVRIMYHPNTRPQAMGLIGIKGPQQTPVIGGVNLPFFEHLIRQSALAAPSLEPSAGYEVTFGHYLGRDSQNRDHFVEFTYYGGNEWEHGAAIHRTETFTVDNTFPDSEYFYPNAADLPDGVEAEFGNLFSPFDADVTGFNRADDQRTWYTSRFDNFEINGKIRRRGRHDRLVMYENGRWRREAQEGCVWSMLFGARGMTLDESFLFYSEGTTTYTGNPDAHTTGTYDIRTHNDMFGVQLGGDAVIRRGRGELGVRLKGGVFMNFADQTSYIETTGAADDLLSNGVDLDEHRYARSRDIAGVAEVGFTASYQLRRNLAVRAAYDLMWINGLALAPEQVNFQAGAPGRINRNGMLLMQSLSMGLELNW